MYFVTVYPVMVVDVPSSAKSFRPLWTNCSSATNVRVQSVDEDVVSLSANKLHNCSGLFQ